MPSKPGVYIFKNKSKTIIYVGKAKDLKKRVTSYFSKSAHDAKTTLLVQEICFIDHIVVSSEIEAFLLEAELIKMHTPHYNIKMLDDKSYPYIAVSKGNNAFVSIVRKKTLKNSEFFGPFPDGASVRIVLRLLRKIFPYQSVQNHQKRTCLYYHLGLCPCVCAHPENIKTYASNIKKLTHFLHGNSFQVLDELYKEQKKLIKDEAFEDAGRIQKQIDSITAITRETYDPFLYLQKPKLQSIREKKEIQDLEQLLKTNGVNIEHLNRIECYDISNISGTNATGSMVVFENGTAVTGKYKRFKIKGLKTPNDFAMHQEVMRRRLSHPQWGSADLMIIDGGKGQVGSILQVLAEKNMHIPVIGLAKRFETIIIPQKNAGRYEFLEVTLPISTPAINLVRRIRDEAHRFAITYHKYLRSKAFLG